MVKRVEGDLWSERRKKKNEKNTGNTREREKRVGEREGYRSERNATV